MAEIAAIPNARSLLASLRGLTSGESAPLVQGLEGARAASEFSNSIAPTNGPAEQPQTPDLLAAPSLIAGPLTLRADTFAVLGQDEASAEEDDNTPAREAEEDEDTAGEEDGAAGQIEEAGPISSQDFASLLQAANEAPADPAAVADNFAAAGQLT
jgi:hypothetical protein